jgi:hypothetical protein
MARKKTTRKLGTKRMWIRRWLQAGKIAQAEAKRFVQHLERTGELLRPTKAAQTGTRTSASSAIAPAPAGSLVTIQYDPSRFRVEFTAIRGGRRAQHKT